MIKVIIPFDKNFNYQECKKLYEQHKKKVNDNQPFKDIVKNTFFYSFYDDEFIGCLYFYESDNKLFLNAFANRHKPTIECLKMSLDWFNCDIYANTKEKSAIYSILKCGFKKINRDLYVYKNRG